MSYAPVRASENSVSKAWLRALEMTAKIDCAPQRIFPSVIEELGKRWIDAPALLCPSGSLSHAALAARANKYARWAIFNGIAKGDTVCLLMPNRPEYLAIWLGLTHLGVVVALINTNLTGEGLAHCITVADPKHIIVDARLDVVLEGLSTHAVVWRHGEAFSDMVAAFPGKQLEECEMRSVSLADPALLIYTSGTTGLPKAAFVSHHRVMMWTHWFAGMMGTNEHDRLYNCLPMYHSVGGVVASGAVLLAGGSVVLREKFSRTQFWNDIATSGATIFQYIGELCRYLLKTEGPVPPHQLRLICGNGLSADVWENFKTRFAIPQILEFYAATEGNFSLYNAEGKAGAIGRVPGFLKHRFGIALIRRGPDGEIFRDETGFCLRVDTNETGEAIGRIAEGGARFEGYSDTGATAKKILRNVFEKNDAYVRTGDLMRQDAEGYFYFVDRIGDTFRWKGENVATTEVAAILAAYPGITAVNVYGVAIPGHDGKAGMAAVEIDTNFDPAGLKSYLVARLPAYARPLFLRLVTQLTITETFKHKKQDLARGGFDPGKVPDTLYVDIGSGYEKLDAALYTRISSGLIRL